MASSRRRSTRPTAQRRSGGRPGSGDPAATEIAEVPVVGPREPCPCGSGKRYKLCHGRGTADGGALVTRPFAGLPGEADWVAMREIVPAATARLSLDARAVRAALADTHPGLDVEVPETAMAATVLPLAWPGLHRADGEVWIGLQSAGSSGDPSRDLAAALVEAIATEPGSPVPLPGLPGPGPRLQDLLDLDRPVEVQVHDGFDFWVPHVEGEELDAEVRDSLERANAAAVPTVRLTGVEAAYWCRIGERVHLRWVMELDEDALLDALARLHTADEDRLGPGSKYVGAFRAHGLLVPVWDLAPGAEAADIEAPAAAFLTRLDAALADSTALDADQRRARAGVVSRQVTLR